MTFSTAVKQSGLKMTTVNGTFSKCETMVTKVVDFDKDTFFEVNCSVVSYPKSGFKWTTIPGEQPKAAIKVVSEVNDKIILFQVQWPVE